MASRIRVLHMIGSLGIGGSQAFVMNMYRKVDKELIQFDFIVDSPEYNYFVPEIERLGGKVYYFPKFNGKNYFRIKNTWRDFFSSHKEYRILHSHVRSYASIYLPIAKAAGVKTIIHSHNNSNGSGVIALAKNILQLPLRFQADYYMACSREAGEWLFGQKVCKLGKFQIVKNAINTVDYIYCEKKRKQIRNEFGLGNKFVLGYLARVTAQKNPLFVIEVMNELVKIRPDAKLLFVGDGELFNTVKKKVIDLKLSDSVFFAGARTDVGYLLSAMDCYILPSFWEGLGISLIEAQAAGLPCICSTGIQDEAIVTDLVKRLPLNLGPEKWAKEIAHNMNVINRMDMSDYIIQAGFDIGENVFFLQNFYNSIIAKN